MKQDNMEQYENYIKEAQLRADEEKIRGDQQEVMIASNDKSMIAEQLDLSEEFERIDYLLRGYVIERNDETGETTWVKPDDKDMIILSDYGVHLIRNTIAWYLNKNTLLSNYDDKTINAKMEDFASDLNDTIFMEYEKVFQYPTFDECKNILKKRIKKKTELKVFSRELLGEELNDKQKEEIKERILKDLEPIIEKELEKIKEQIIKNKLKRFMIIIREVQDAIHSTYLRAWKGQERTTLRQHIHISENKGPAFMPQQKTGMFDWIKRKWN